MAEALHIWGRLHRLERVAQEEPLGRLVALLVGVSWLPLMIVSGVEWLVARPEPLVRDLSIHARLLVALPLLLASRRVLDVQCDVVTERLFEEGIVRPADAPGMRALLDRVSAWRDSVLPDLVFFFLALAVGVATLTGLGGPAGLFHGLSESRLGPVRFWYALVSLPLFQVVMWRSLFRWLLWLRVQGALSRVSLRLLLGHADRRAGLGFVKVPTLAYSVMLLLSVGAVLCAGWGTQIARYGARIEAFRSLFFIYVLVGIVLLPAPLFLFVPQLARARFAGLRKYGGLVSDYTEQLLARWVDHTDRGKVLGTPDLQSFADISTSFRENVEKMQVFLFGRSDWALLVVAALAPAVPFLFVTKEAHEAIAHLLRLLVGVAG